MKDADRDTYHCNQTRKMQISKIDPTIAFCFYLRNDKDFIQFYWLMKNGKKRFGSDWPFSLMDAQYVQNYFAEKKKMEMEEKLNQSIGDFGQEDISKS